MKVLKTVQNRSKAQRDRLQLRRETINEATVFFKYAAALVLHDLFGFGRKRVARFAEALVTLFVEYSDRYDSEYLLQSFKSKCRDRGIEFEE